FMTDKIWENAFNEAEELANYDQELNIIGSDIDHKMIEISKANALEAGLADLIEFKQMQVSDLSINKNNGYIVGNPHYGQRISQDDEVSELYSELVNVMLNHPSCSVYILSIFKQFESSYAKKVTKQIKQFNQFIENDCYNYIIMKH